MGSTQFWFVALSFEPMKINKARENFEEISRTIFEAWASAPLPSNHRFSYEFKSEKFLWISPLCEVFHHVRYFTIMWGISLSCAPFHHHGRYFWSVSLTYYFNINFESHHITIIHSKWSIYLYLHTLTYYHNFTYYQTFS